VRRVAVVHEIRSEDLVSGGAERTYDCPARATGWFPQTRRQALDSEERLDGNNRSLIEIIAALGE
jgi:hypothetical protein